MIVSKKKRILTYFISVFFIVSSIVPSIMTVTLNTPVYASAASINPKGNVLFQDDFERGNYEGWAANGGTWAVEDDVGNKVLRQKHTSNEAYIFAGDNSWTDYSIEAKIRLDDGGAFPGILARVQDTNNFYYFQINKNARGLVLDKKVNGSFTRLAEADLYVRGNTWYTLKLVLEGNIITAYLDGKKVMRVVDNTFSRGRIGFRTRWGVVSIDDVIVTDERILYDNFEDGNLDGWNVEKGEWLIVENAYGSKTEGSYVLQAGINMDVDDTPVEVIEPPIYVATHVGQQPTLPEEVRVRTLDGQETTAPVIWDLSGISFDEAYKTVEVSGAVTDQLKVTAKVEVVPEGLVYFIDSGIGDRISPAYEAVKKLVPELRNTVSDKVYEGDWGYVNDDIHVKGNTDINNKMNTGLWAGGKGSTSKLIIYRLPLDAGAYTVTAGFYEWWAGPRYMKISVVYTNEEGEKVTCMIKDNFSVNGTSREAIIEGTITIPVKDEIEYRVEIAGGTEAPVISWLAIAKEIQNEAVTDEYVPEDESRVGDESLPKDEPVSEDEAMSTGQSVSEEVETTLDASAVKNEDKELLEGANSPAESNQAKADNYWAPIRYMPLANIAASGMTVALDMNGETGEGSQGLIVTGDVKWDNYWVQANYMALKDSGMFGIVFRSQDADNYYLFRANLDQQKFELVLNQSGNCTVLSDVDYSITPLNWYVISVKVIANTMQCYVNGQLIIQEKDDTHAFGKIGFYYEDSLSYIDEVQAGIMQDPSKRMVEIDGRAEGRVFEGIGMVSGNNSSRLLMDYPEEQLEDIIDLLFKPNFGASLHSLKLEIGSDVNSSSGTEPSHMRSLNDFDITRGAGLWLAQKAKAVNPDLELEALRWGTPRFIGNNLDYKYEYYKRYLQGARDVYGLEFDYLAPDQNEGEFDRNWLVNVLAPRLKEDGFGHIKFVVRDAVSNPWAIVNDLERDPELYELVSAIGVHYTTSSPPNAKNIGKSLWHSEAWPTFPSSGFRGERGVLDLAKVIMDSYNNGRMTKYLMQPFVEAWYPIVPYNTKSGMAANKPWSGYYELTPGFWMIAHFTQFAKPGWIFLDDGCYSSATHNYITLKKPDGSGDYSIIIVNITGEPQEYTFKLSGGLSGDTVHVWKTTEKEIFVHEKDIEPQDYTYTIVIEPYSVYSLTTTTGQQKGQPKHGIPEDTHLELPYQDNFDSYEVGKAPRYTCDQGGAFEVHEGGLSGKALRQVITADIKPIDWVYRTTPDPYTILGDLEWANYSVSCDVNLEGQGDSSAYVIVGGRVIDSPGDGNPPISYHLKLYGDGKWELKRHTRILTNGIIENFDATKWHNIKLSFKHENIKAYVNGEEVASYDDGIGGIASGSVVLGSGYHYAKFDNLLVEPVDDNTPIYVQRIDNTDSLINYIGEWSHIIDSYSNYKRTLSNTSGSGPVLIVNDGTKGTGLHEFNFVSIDGASQWGYWNQQQGAYNRDNSWSSYPGNYYEVKFFGTQIKVYCAIDSNCGIAAFSIDGGEEVEVDLYNPTRVDQTLVYTSPVLPEGEHVLRVRVTGKKNPNSTSTVVNADFVEVIRETYEVTALEYTFRGVGINIVGNVSTNSVKAEIFVDGEKVDSVDITGIGNGQKKLLYRVANLPAGEHTVRFVPLGSVSIDYVEVLEERILSGEPGEPGEPSEPEEPSEPGEPGEPDEPSEPGEPSEPEDPGEPVEEKPSDKDGLVKTGSWFNLQIFWLSGSLLFVVGAGLLICRKKIKKYMKI